MSKIVFLDVDGTLIDYETKLPDSARKAVDLARANGHKVYICTGMAFDDTYEKHLLSNEQIEQMNLFLKKNHYELDETLPILQLKPCEESQEQKAVRTENYLNQLQQQEMSKNQQVAQTPMMGMEL